MSKAKELLNEINEEDVTSVQLKKLLWNKGLKNFNAELDVLNKELKPYQSVSSLPKGITTNDLSMISADLTVLSAAIGKISAKIKDTLSK